MKTIHFNRKEGIAKPAGFAGLRAKQVWLELENCENNFLGLCSGVRNEGN